MGRQPGRQAGRRAGGRARGRASWLAGWRNCWRGQACHAGRQAEPQGMLVHDFIITLPHNAAKHTLDRLARPSPAWCSAGAAHICATPVPASLHTTPVQEHRGTPSCHPVRTLAAANSPKLEMASR